MSVERDDQRTTVPHCMLRGLIDDVCEYPAASGEPEPRLYDEGGYSNCKTVANGLGQDGTIRRND